MKYEEHYTIEDYNHWDGEWELIYGTPFAMAPSPTVTHQSVAGNIFYELKHMTLCPDCLVLSEIDYEIAIDTVVRPDVLLICKPIEEKVDKTPEIISKCSHRRRRAGMRRSNLNCTSKPACATTSWCTRATVSPKSTSGWKMDGSSSKKIVRMKPSTSTSACAGFHWIFQRSGGGSLPDA